MSRGLAGLAVVLLLAAPACGGDPLLESLLAELNVLRRDAGVRPLEPHPVLASIARDRAAAVASSGGLASDRGTIERTTTRLYRAGYAAHRWNEGTLIATSDEAILEQWHETRPGWFREAVTGDFEDVGIGLSRFDGRPVVSIVLALKTRTVERRQAEPLKDLDKVRAQILTAVNAARRRHDRPPVEAEPLLDLTAQRHAEDMLRRAYYDHRSPEGEGVADRARAAGYRGFRSISENIAKGPFSPQEVVRRWLDSPGHRRNILRRSATETGAGVVFGENERGFEILWVQIFAGR